MDCTFNEGKTKALVSWEKTYNIELICVFVANSS